MSKADELKEKAHMKRLNVENCEHGLKPWLCEICTPPRGKGHPKKEVDLNKVYGLAKIHCTESEIASLCDVSEETLRAYPNFLRVYQAGLNVGKKSLRRKLFYKADKGNMQAIVWLSKQHIGMHEPRVDVGIQGGEQPVRIVYERADKEDEE